jgi:hypothetical protein
VWKQARAIAVELGAMAGTKLVGVSLNARGDRRSEPWRRELIV